MPLRDTPRRAPYATAIRENSRSGERARGEGDADTLSEESHSFPIIRFLRLSTRKLGLYTRGLAAAQRSLSLSPKLPPPSRVLIFPFALFLESHLRTRCRNICDGFSSRNRLSIETLGSSNPTSLSPDEYAHWANTRYSRRSFGGQKNSREEQPRRWNLLSRGDSGEPQRSAARRIDASRVAAKNTRGSGERAGRTGSRSANRIVDATSGTKDQRVSSRYSPMVASSAARVQQSLDLSTSLILFGATIAREQLGLSTVYTHRITRGTLSD